MRGLRLRIRDNGLFLTGAQDTRRRVMRAAEIGDLIENGRGMSLPLAGGRCRLTTGRLRMRIPDRIRLQCRASFLRLIRHRIRSVLVLALACGAVAAMHVGTVRAQPAELADVVVVGNNWDGTADVFDPRTFKVIKRLNIVPDRAERMKEIDDAGLWRRFTFWFVRTVPGEGHDQLVDDMFTSHDGRFLYVSRPSFADVVAIDVNSGQIVWRTKVEGSRADHAAI